MKIIKDLVPVDSSLLHRHEIFNEDGSSTGTYIYLKYAPGELVQTPTPVNAALFEDMYGYSNETITVNKTTGKVVKTSNGVTETTTKNGNSVTTVKTDGAHTITRTITKNNDGTVIDKVVTS